MKIGVCSVAKNASIIKSKGFDYIELPVQSYANLSREELKSMIVSLKETELPVLAANFFFPADLKVVGEDVRRDIVHEYCKRAVDRSIELGVKHLTVGSGGARNAPEGFSKRIATLQFGEWLCEIGDLLYGTDCVASFEPIRNEATNILNTLLESTNLAKFINHPKVKVMVDFQQMTAQGELFSSISNAGSMLSHAHISNSNTLRCPLNEEEDNYAEFFEELRIARYKGNLSVETVFYDDTLSIGFVNTLIKKYNFERE